MKYLAVLALVACGDNLHPAPPDSSTPLTCSPVSGNNVLLTPIVQSCTAMGAPPAPACLDDAMILVTSPPDDKRLFAVGEHGRIWIVQDGRLLPQPFIDISAESGGEVYCPAAVSELGLLGLAFHPQFATNGLFYVYFTALNPDTADTQNPYVDVLARYSVSATDPNKADRKSGVTLFSVPDPFSNHNGGMLEFGSDGMLYISTGDGGATVVTGSDPFRYAQNTSSLLGKMLRIDVDAGTPYAIPPDNPFGNEVFITGLRNPWRWSFDRETGDMWIGDVGLATYEEVDYLPAGQQAGVNLGWSKYEAFSCFEPPCDPTGMTFPVDVRDHADGWRAVIGGTVYRGACYPDLYGWYVYSDCGTNQLYRGQLRSDGTLYTEGLPNATAYCPTSVHAASDGELYVGDILGNLFKVEVTP